MHRRRLHGALLVSLLLAALAAATWLAPGASGQQPPRPPNELRSANPQSQCAGRYEVWVDGRLHGCSHGYDPYPQGVDRSRDPIRNPRDGQTSPSTPGAAPSGPAAAAAGNSTVCIGDGSSGPRVQAIYVFGPDGNNSASVIPSIKAWAGDVEAVFANSAAETGGTRHVRFYTDASCQVVVATTSVSAAEINDFSAMVSALEKQGFNRTDRKYLVWADTASANICGIGEIWVDDQVASANLNTKGDMFARTDRPCWGLANSTESHELMHTLGGVATTAPHATPLNHCVDESDRMCYADGSGLAMQPICPTSHENRFDCNHDDYYSTAPTGWLAAHWNTASNPYLDGSVLGPPTISATPTSLYAGQTLNVSWSNIANPTGNDIFMLYPTSITADTAYIAYRYTGGAVAGSLPLIVPDTAAPGTTYELRLFSNNGASRLAKFAPITVNVAPPATISATPTTVAAGQTLSVSWSNVVVPTTNDVFMLYPSSTTADTAYIAYRYTGGAVSGSLSLTVPATAAPKPTYELRLWSNNGARRLATFGPVTVTGPPPATVSATPTTVKAGSALTVSWSGITGPTNADLVALYPRSDTGDTSHIAYRYTGGAASGSLALTVPANAPSGSNYELRLWSNNGAKRLATFGPLTVNGAPPPMVSETPSTVVAGNAISVTWSGIAAPTANDVVLLYPSSGAGDTAWIAYRYTGGAASGTVPLTVPATAAQQSTYELRLWSNNGAQRLATSTPFTVTAAPAPTLSATPTPVKAGSALTVTWANISAPTNADLVALYPRSDTGDTSHIAYRYTGGAASGSLSLTVPATAVPGTTYELRLWSNNGAKRLATFAPITVTP